MNPTSAKPVALINLHESAEFTDKQTVSEAYKRYDFSVILAKVRQFPMSRFWGYNIDGYALIVARQGQRKASQRRFAGDSSSGSWCSTIITKNSSSSKALALIITDLAAI